LGVKHLVGLDLTDAAVARLRGAFPDVDFVRGDITDATPALSPASYDIVSCMDVMFHVVDHDRCLAALRNIASLLAPGGLLIWSDFFVHGRESADPHIVWRSLYRIEAMLAAAGLEVELREPLFYLMNEPRDAPRIAVPLWKAAVWLACRTERTGGLAGRLLYMLDRRLTASRAESPSTEIMVCRKRGT
jgi:SAM-dependent methyltransferase